LISEFLTPSICRAADRHRAPIILHISRLQRFADTENIRQLKEVTQTYPALRLIVAHLGRSYNPLYLEKGLELLGGAGDWWYDFSAVTNPEVHKLALRAIPHDRLCFGFDNPIMLSRGYYEFPTPSSYTMHIHGYNLESADYPPLAHQILKGFKEAAEAVGLSRESVRKIFFDNAMDLLAAKPTLAWARFC